MMHKTASFGTMRERHLSTPYAPRTSVATRHTDYPRSLQREVSRRSPYHPLSDPHLATYFRSKLRGATSPALLPRAQSENKGTPQRPRPQPPPATCYQVSVKTGGGGGEGGTSARVYVTLWGSGGKLGRKRLVKGGEKEFTFAPGSLERFRLRGPNLGDVTKLMVEHNGLKREEAWFLEYVTVTEVGGGGGGGRGGGGGGGRRKWHFPCKQWLSLHHSDCQLSRTLKARPVRPGEGGEEVEYTVEVHTGDVRGGGSDANVFLTLGGTNGSSPKTHLKGSSFDRGSVVVTSLVCQDLGPLCRASVEHDGSGFAPDWFLEKLVVYKCSFPEKKLIFRCGQWLSREQGDGSIHRVLHPSCTPPPQTRSEKSYIISTQTGSMRGAGTDANVFITLYGSEGNSGERRLDNDIANFERGRRDTFRLRNVELGRIDKVKVRHDNSGPGPGWYLEWVEVEVGGDGGGRGKEAWHFPCGRWLDVGEGDGVIECELSVRGEEGRGRGREKKEEEGYRYTLHITTGDHPGAGTNANVYVVLHGRGGESGKVWLESGQRSLLAGHTDTFEVRSAQLVSPLEQVIVGHDNSGVGPGWFLEKILVECGTTGGRWLFDCHRWLCLDSGDGRIERELHPTVEGDRGGGERRWRVHVWTSDIRGAGTDASVTLQVHGEHCSSSLLPLGTSTDNFEQGEEDIFEVSLPSDMGAITAITIGHDNTCPYPEWHLDRVEVESGCRGERYMFPCGRWLTAGKGDGHTSVRIGAIPKPTDRQTSHIPPPSRPPSTPSQGPSHLPIPSLTVSSAEQDGTAVDGRTDTQTGSCTGGVDGGRDYESDQFESDIDLSDTSLVSPESSAPQTSIQELDSTITNEYIRQLRYAQLSSIDSSQAHSPTPNPPSPLPPLPTKDMSPGHSATIPYTVHVVASSCPSPSSSSSSSHPVIVLVGELGTSSPIPLKPVSPALSPGRSETFSVEGDNVGNITTIKVHVEGSPEGNSWLIEEISIHSPITGHTYLFPWGQWAGPGQEYVLKRAELDSSANTSSTLAQSCPTAAGLVAYEVKVSTADKKHAGTSYDLHLVVVGEKETSREFVIPNPARGPRFQRGQSDSFQIAVPPLGTLTAVRVAHCPQKCSTVNGGRDSVQWYLFQVVLTRLTDKTRYYFLCRQWIKSSPRDSVRYTEVPLLKVE